MILERFRELSQGLVVKILLGLITVPFALFGVDYYFRDGGGTDAVAHVEGIPISQARFAEALRGRLDELRNMLGQNAPDPAQLNTPPLRNAVLQRLVDQTVLQARARSVGLAVPDKLVAERIASIDAFQDNGHFSQTRYEQILKAQGLTPARFESDVRDEIALQTFQDGIAQSLMVPKVAVDAWARLSNQTREISVATFSVDSYLDQAKVDDKAVRAWYDAHLDQYRTDERVQLEYLTLSPEALGRDIEISADDLHKFYDEQNAGKRFNTPEERRASHILITVKADAPAAERAAAKAKAEQVLAEVKAHPDQFAKLAEQYSQDPGSAKQGGDLGFFGRGAMVKPFEDAAFGMKAGETSGLVQSDFGYHIIHLTEVKGAHVKSFEEASAELTRELRTQRAAKKFAEAAETFSNLVFEQSGSLKPAADSLKLEIQKTGWITRVGAGAPPVLANPKVMQAVFAPEVVKDKRNTAAVEAGPSLLVAARALAYEPATPKPFTDVSAAIRTQLQRTEASRLAVEAGKAALAALQAGKTPDTVHFADAKVTTRATAAASLPAAVVDPAFKLDPAHLPAYAGAEVAGNGYALARVSKVEDGKTDDVTVRKQAEQTLQRAVGQGEFNGVLASLRKTASISISKGAVERAGPSGQAPDQP